MEFGLCGVLRSLGPCFARPGIAGPGIVSGVTCRLAGLFGNGLLLTLVSTSGAGSTGFGLSS